MPIFSTSVLLFVMENLGKNPYFILVFFFFKKKKFNYLTSHLLSNNTTISLVNPQFCMH